jgi:hypothetical protein
VFENWAGIGGGGGCEDVQGYEGEMGTNFTEIFKQLQKTSFTTKVRLKKKKVI